MITRSALKEAGKAEEKLSRVGFRVIAAGQILNIMVLVFFVCDAVLILIDQSGSGYSFFIYLAWSSALAATILFYLGYVMPDWFKKRLTE